jgi:hypothetical protein
MTAATRTRQRPNVGHREVPWERFVRTDCACDPLAPCLLHFDDLDWRARALAWARAGVTPPNGR